MCLSSKLFTETYSMIQRAFVEEAASHTTTYTWWKWFKDRESLDDDEQCGRPATAVHDEKVVKVHVLLIEQPRLTFSDGTLWSIKSSFVNCSEKKPSAHCSASALRLVLCVFANSLINERVKEQEYYASSTLLLLFYSFINFSRRAKTNFIGTLSRLYIRYSTRLAD